MKKLFLLSMVCLMALSMNAQRCAVLEFKAGVGISQNDVDGISAIFITYFQPEGYTMVERSQIDKVIDEQGFQRSKMTQSQMVRIGEILNVSKIVVGDINVVMSQYNVDARVINVETGTIAATEGATFDVSNYRACMQNVATKLAAKIAISSGGTVRANNAPSTQGYIDLGLPSGTLWKATNESGYYKYDEAMSKFGKNMPSQEQWQELIDYCTWTSRGVHKGYIVMGVNGNSIILPPGGAFNCEGERDSTGNEDFYECIHTGYWSSTIINTDAAWGWYIKNYNYYKDYSEEHSTGGFYKCYTNCVRLVYNP